MSVIETSPELDILDSDKNDDGLDHFCHMDAVPDENGNTIALCGAKAPWTEETVWWDELKVTPNDCIVCLEIARRECE